MKSKLYSYAENTDILSVSVNLFGENRPPVALRGLPKFWRLNSAGLFSDGGVGRLTLEIRSGSSNLGVNLVGDVAAIVDVRDESGHH